MRQRIGLVLGPALFLLFIWVIDLSPDNPAVSRTAAAAILIATWWITEALPIPATSLLPLVLFPVLGVMKGKDVASTYMNSSIFLFMGGFLIALALEKWQLHRRIALNILMLLGDRPRKLILGFMIATAALSMWISNTATAMMMLPIGIAVITRAEAGITDPRFRANFSLALMLSIAYSASIGGIGTLIGTPPNLAFSRIFAISFPDAPAITFAEWLIMALPLVVVFLAISWFLLVRVLAPVSNERFAGGRDIVMQELKSLGAFTTAEKRVGVIFAITAILWITRSNIDLGFLNIPGWSNLLGLKGFVDDGTVAIAMGVLLFIIPSGKGSGQFLMNWDTAKRLPWGILLLFGGGFALANGFKVSGLSEWLGLRLTVLADVPPVIMVAGTSTLLTFLTELTSNTGTTEMILPVLASLAVAVKIHPLLLMLPATISASCAFMLPVATPPNAIIFGSGRVPIAKMATVGIVLNLIGIVLVTTLVMLVIAPMFGLLGVELPDWAH
ncbi:MAG: DASS family sodium-coupled anion symporter [Candidatus Hatepunaea meridiana]|nr:DASS family sodium-coupled anion symporter [Candidatus Hatepunaea meridiana]